MSSDLVTARYRSVHMTVRVKSRLSRIRQPTSLKYQSFRKLMMYISIINLAVADLLYLSTIPFVVSTYFSKYQSFRK